MSDDAAKRPRGRHRVLFSGLIVLATLGAHDQLVRAEVNTAPKPVERPYYVVDEDQSLGRASWRYFQANRLPTGFVSSAAGFTATTMWDVGSQLAGMVAALEFAWIERPAFDAWLSETLTAIEKLPLVKDELPNKSYNALTLQPSAYGDLTKRREIGFSAIDLGRLVAWLDIVGARYPEHKDACDRVVAGWRRDRLTHDGQLMGTEIAPGPAGADGRESWNQEGRLGYEQYSAYGLSKIGIVAPRALDPYANVVVVQVDGVPLHVDRRDAHASVAHNYVTSEPYILDGLETGFRALPREFAGSVLQLQTRRTVSTGVLTAWSEDNIDRAPWFVYNNVFVDGHSWSSIDSSGHDATANRGDSLKAALAWHVLFRTETTARVYQGMRWVADPSRGAFAGYYEESGLPNRALTLNTNGVILEALLRAKIGRPIELWAHGG